MLIASRRCSSPASRLRRGRSPSIRQVKVRPMWCKGSSSTTPTATLGAWRRWTARHRRRPATTAWTTQRGRPSPCAAISIRWTIRSTTPPTRPADHYSSTPATGMHFIMFQPTIAIFNLVRLAMDGHYPDQTLSCRTALPPRRHQLGPVHDPPAELPGSTSSPSLLPARRVPDLTPARHRAPADQLVARTRPSQEWRPRGRPG